MTKNESGIHLKHLFRTLSEVFTFKTSYAE